MESITALPASIQLVLLAQARNAINELLKDQSLDNEFPMTYENLTNALGALVEAYMVIEAESYRVVERRDR